MDTSPPSLRSSVFMAPSAPGIHEVQFQLGFESTSSAVCLWHLMAQSRAMLACGSLARRTPPPNRRSELDPSGGRYVDLGGAGGGVFNRGKPPGISEAQFLLGDDSHKISQEIKSTKPIASCFSLADTPRLKERAAALRL